MKQCRFLPFFFVIAGFVLNLKTANAQSFSYLYKLNPERIQNSILRAQELFCPKQPSLRCQESYCENVFNEVSDFNPIREATLNLPPTNPLSLPILEILTEKPFSFQKKLTLYLDWGYIYAPVSEQSTKILEVTFNTQNCEAVSIIESTFEIAQDNSGILAWGNKKYRFSLRKLLNWKLDLEELETNFEYSEARQKQLIDNPFIQASFLKFHGLSIFEAQKIKHKAPLVAVFDTGIDYNHMGLYFNLVPGLDFEDFDERPYDSSIHYPNITQHGTAVASMIAKGHPEIPILPVRISLSETTPQYFEAILEARKKGAKIFQLSVGTQNEKAAHMIRLAIEAFPDVLFVLAAGNHGQNLEKFKLYPQVYSFPNTLVVGAYTKNTEHAQPPGILPSFFPSRFTNYSPQFVDLLAEGENLDVLIPNTRHSTLAPHLTLAPLSQPELFNLKTSAKGTSFAAPKAAQALALFWEKNPSFSAAELKRKFIELLPTENSLEGFSKNGKFLP